MHIPGLIPGTGKKKVLGLALSILQFRWCQRLHLDLSLSPQTSTQSSELVELRMLPPHKATSFLIITVEFFLSLSLFPPSLTISPLLPPSQYYSVPFAWSSQNLGRRRRRPHGGVEDHHTRSHLKRRGFDPPRAEAILEKGRRKGYVGWGWLSGQ